MSFRRLVLSITVGLMSFTAATAHAANTTVAAGKTLTLDQDLVLSGSDTLEINGTAAAPCKIEGNNHGIKTGDNWTGQVKMNYCTLHAVGGPSNTPLALKLTAGGEAPIDIEHCTFDASAGVYLANNGNSATIFRNNNMPESSLTHIDKAVEKCQSIFEATGSSPKPKFFQGNRIGVAHIEIRAANWLIGGDTDAETNLITGVRIRLNAYGEGTVVRGNYLHNFMPTRPDIEYYSQVHTFMSGPGVLVEHNIIRDGEWITQFVEGEFRYNIIADILDHNLMRTGSYGKIHHNLFFTGKPKHFNGQMGSSITVVYPPKNGAKGLEVYNNVFDGTDTMPVPGIDAGGEGQLIASLRNNVYCNFKLPEKYIWAPASMVCVGWTEKELTTPPTGRLLYADYNCFFNPLSPNKNIYGLAVKDKTLRKDDGFAKHDLPVGGEVNAQVDPKFKGPLPKEFPFQDEDIKSGKVTLSQMLAHFRDLYTPAPGSPLIDAGDPADGAGTDIGMIDAGKPAKIDQFGKWGGKK